MRLRILSADYPRFLRDLYLSHPGLCEEPYAEQMAARNDSLFGVADFYSRNFKAHGHEAAEFHINNPWLQYAWAQENGLAISPLEPPPDALPQMASAPAPVPVSRRLMGKAHRIAKRGKRALGPLGEALGRWVDRRRRAHILKTLG